MGDTHTVTDWAAAVLRLVADTVASQDADHPTCIAETIQKIIDLTDESLLHGDSQLRILLSHLRSKTQGESAMAEQILLQPGGTARLPEGNTRKYLHWCVRGNHTFMSDDPAPLLCGNCRQKYWQGNWEGDRRQTKRRTKAVGHEEA